MILPSTASLLLLSLPLLASAAHSSSNTNAHKALLARQNAARQAGLEYHLANMNTNEVPSALKKRGDGKCKTRVASASASVTVAPPAESEPVVSSSSWVAPAPSSSAWEAPSASPVNVQAAVATEAPKKSKNSKGDKGLIGSIVSGVEGILNLNDPTCGSSNAQSFSSNSAGPNGAANFLQCGLDNGGWTPPFIHVNELIAADLSTVISRGNSPFEPCKPYVDRFYAIGSEFGIPPILIASFAMQESTCNPSVTGGGGEQGMFQITKDKCGGAPGGNCKDVDYNMRTAMKYFSDMLDSNGGDSLLSIGSYNGWHKGMTYADATAAANSDCCRCQKNADYLNQMLNGFMQGLDGYTIGNYWNLKVCGA